MHIIDREKRLEELKTDSSVPMYRRLTIFLIRCILSTSSVLWLAFTMADAIQKVLNSDKNWNETEKKACLNLTALSWTEWVAHYKVRLKSHILIINSNGEKQLLFVLNFSSLFWSFGIVWNDGKNWRVESTEKGFVVIGNPSFKVIHLLSA